MALKNAELPTISFHMKQWRAAGTSEEHERSYVRQAVSDCPVQQSLDLLRQPQG